MLLHLFFGFSVILCGFSLYPALVIWMSHFTQIFPTLVPIIVSVGVN